MKSLIMFFLAMVSLASYAQAGDSRYTVKFREYYAEKDGKPVTDENEARRIINNAPGNLGAKLGENSFSMAPARQNAERRSPQVNRPSGLSQLPPGARPGGKFSTDRDGTTYYVEPGSRGMQYRFKPDTQGPAQSAQKRIPANLSRDTGRTVRGQKIAPPPAVVPYHLEKGEVVSDLNRYTEKPSTREILRSTGKTESQAKKMKVGEATLIPEKRLKSEYRDPLKRIDELRAELGRVNAENAQLHMALNQLRAIAKETDPAIFKQKLEELEGAIKSFPDRPAPGTTPRTDSQSRTMEKRSTKAEKADDEDLKLLGGLASRAIHRIEEIKK